MDWEDLSGSMEITTRGGSSMASLMEKESQKKAKMTLFMKVIGTEELNQDRGRNLVLMEVITKVKLIVFLPDKNRWIPK